MSLQVIGSGFGRTGTKSLKEALERLGFGPCHHMHEVVSHPESVPGWVEAFAGKPVDWERLLVFDVAEGWGPLCAFLGVPVPDEPFPHRNLRADFWEVLGGEPPG